MSWQSRWRYAMRTTVRSEWAAVRLTRNAHRVREAFTFQDGTIYARWVCGGTGSDVIPLIDRTQAESNCLTCVLSLTVPLCPVVYRAYDVDGRLLYIGSSVSMPGRLRGHMSTTHWWGEVDHLTYETYTTELDARRAEIAAIADEETVYNRAGVRRRRRGGALA